MEIKVCTKCKRELTFNDFTKDKNGKNGLKAKCRDCQKQYQQDNKEATAEYDKQYYQEHKEKKNQYQQDNKATIAEQKKQYYQEHKDTIAERNKRYQGKNKTTITEQTKQYRQENKATIAEYQKQYAKAHPEQFRQKSQVRKARKKNLPATLTTEQWINIKQSFNNSCAYCGCTEKLEQDHFIPLSKGGEYAHSNIIPACKSCNCSKNVSNFSIWYFKQSFYSKKRENAIFKFLNYRNGIQQLALV